MNFMTAVMKLYYKRRTLREFHAGRNEICIEVSGAGFYFVSTFGL